MTNDVTNYYVPYTLFATSILKILIKNLIDEIPCGPTLSFMQLGLNNSIFFCQDTWISNKILPFFSLLFTVEDLF